MPPDTEPPVLRDAGAPLHRILIDDLRAPVNLPGSVAHGVREIYRFYLTEDERERLAGMGRIRRAFRVTWWSLKSLLLKLSPGRRLALFAALVMAVWGSTTLGLFGLGPELGVNLRAWAIVVLLFVLALELKDKLVARDEIAVARQVQMALLPTTPPRVAGWSVWMYTRPANDVGGDLVDYIALPGERVGLVLGDVAGKGMGAALLAAKLQATLRAVVADTDGLHALGARLNDVLYRDGLDNRFATLFFLTIEPGSGRVPCLNAGHNPALIVRAGGGDDDMLSASSRPLGMFPDSRYEEAVAELGIGDMLIVYSDGLTEAESPDGEQYGLERLRRLTPHLQGTDVESGGRRILAEVDAFLAGERVADDLSLVIVRRES